MAYSSAFRALEKRFKALRQKFVPKKFDPTGSYTQFILDKSRAFRLLIHAELEYYFERRALDIATKAFDAWKTRSSPSVPLVHLLCNVEGEQKGLPRKTGTGLTALTLVGKSYGQYRHVVENNHGLKTENILQMMLPIAVREGDLDTTWLLTLDGFASKRGEAAHTASVTYQIDPQDDLKTIIQIIDGVRDLDIILDKIESSIK